MNVARKLLVLLKYIILLGSTTAFQRVPAVRFRSPGLHLLPVVKAVSFPRPSRPGPRNNGFAVPVQQPRHPTLITRTNRFFSPATAAVTSVRGVAPRTSLRAAVVVGPAAVILPSVQTIALSCLLPTSLGFVKYEYGVSYGYGTSVAAVAYLVLKQLPKGSVAYWHALALLGYGVRLNLFLLYREICIPRFRKFRDMIEERRTSGTNEGAFLLRVPFVVSCAFLYACLAAPLFLTSQLTAPNAFVNTCVITSYVGFVVAALGDLQKSVVKAKKGADTLVTGGIFYFLRHPNYTGEAIGWTSSFLASVAAAVATNHWTRSCFVYLVASALGWIGIVYVLGMATTGLEKKQKEKYGDSEKYKLWIEGSWAGPTLPTPTKEV